MKKLTKNSHHSHFSTDIPAGYSTTRICILPCSPTMHYIYWDVPAAVQKPGATLSLRISCQNEELDVTAVLCDIPLTNGVNSMYYQFPAFEMYLRGELILTDTTVQTVLCSATYPPLPQEHHSPLPEHHTGTPSIPTSDDVSCRIYELARKIPAPAARPKTKMHRAPLTLPSSSTRL